MKKISSGLLVLSLILVFLGYNTLREALMVTEGNKLSLDKSYLKADKLFEGAADRYSSKAGNKNRGINLYNGEEYDKLLETGAGEEFFRGNAYAYLAEREKEPRKIMENYEKALEEYKSAMNSSEDINIKRNYEIISKRIEDMKNNTQKQQKQNKNDQKDQNKDKQNKDNNQDQQQGTKQQSDSSSNQKNSDKKEASQQNQRRSDQQKKDQARDDDQKSSSEKTSEKDKSKASKGEAAQGRKAEKDTTQRREALTILERLEGSEDQAFKNNERLENIGGEDSHEAW